MPDRDVAWPQGTPCWVDVQVHDLDAAREFYGPLFGWDIQDSPPEAGGYLMAMLGGRPAAAIGPKPAEMAMPAAWTTYLAADDADDIHDRILAAGGRPFMPPIDVLDIGRMFVAADPTGAVFGVWQGRSHIGAGVYNEPGAYTWNELQTGDYSAGQDFYTAVFGYSYTEVGDGQSVNYSTTSTSLPGSRDPVAGVNDLTKMPGHTPPHWLAWFAVADCDAALSAAQGMGATVMMPAIDSPFGRMAVLAGPQGEAFGVIASTSTTGQAASSEP